MPVRKAMRKKGKNTKKRPECVFNMDEFFAVLDAYRHVSIFQPADMEPIPALRACKKVQETEEDRQPLITPLDEPDVFAGLC